MALGEGSPKDGPFWENSPLSHRRFMYIQTLLIYVSKETKMKIYI